MTNTAFIPVPISNPPDKDGYYMLFVDKTIDIQRSAVYYFSEGKYYAFFHRLREGKPTDVIGNGYTHWLKPVSLSDMLGEAWEAGNEWGNTGERYKQKAIQSIINKYSV